jgi:hypothetical protein
VLKYYRSPVLQTISNQKEGCPVVGMGEGVWGQLSFAIDTDACTREVLGGEGAVEEFGLDLLEGFGFGFALGEIGVKLLHEESGARVADVPEGGEDGFDIIFEEEVADAGDFDAVGGTIAHARLAGGEDDEVKFAETIVGEGVDVVGGEVGSAAGDDVGLFDVAGDEGSVGSEVENFVGSGFEVGFEAVEVEGAIEDFGAGVDA